ncbi:class I SAM-dependent methyltransferase [Flavobacteriaceae bacterium F08102]|nr:class I SAM-dependent methyltransferase [Flavobacteriaceae bacterium F08102]
MTPLTNLKQQVGAKIDIYIFDQILKNRYALKDLILDAGCGHGRNIHWFLAQGMTVYGIDKLKDRIHVVKEKYPTSAQNFQVANLEQIPFDDAYFDHVICSAVLHFAKSEDHFKQQFSELVRVLKPKGHLFIRMTSDIGIADKVVPKGNGVYFLPDKTHRFLLTKSLLSEVMKMHKLTFVEPLKTTNVNDLRCMTTVVLIKR